MKRCLNLVLAVLLASGQGCGDPQDGPLSGFGGGKASEGGQAGEVMMYGLSPDVFYRQLGALVSDGHVVAKGRAKVSLNINHESTKDGGSSFLLEVTTECGLLTMGCPDDLRIDYYWYPDGRDVLLHEGGDPIARVCGFVASDGRAGAVLHLEGSLRTQLGAAVVLHSNASMQPTAVDDAFYQAFMAKTDGRGSFAFARASAGSELELFLFSDERKTAVVKVNGESEESFDATWYFNSKNIALNRVGTSNQHLATLEFYEDNNGNPHAVLFSGPDLLPLVGLSVPISPTSSSTVPPGVEAWRFRL